MPISEIAELILKIALFILNATTVAIVVILISKWHRRMEDKLNGIKSYIQHVADRNDIVYINQLEEIKLYAYALYNAEMWGKSVK